MNILTKTAQDLRGLATGQDACAVSFSGGKDSRIVMDMARRSFKKVVGFFLYFCPGLRCDAERLAIADEWGIEVLQYPSNSFIAALKSGLYCFKTQAHQALPTYEQSDIYAAVRRDTGIRAILTGMKKSDSMARKRMLTKYTAPDVFHPLINWKNFDCLAYCKLHGIPLPPTPPRQRSSGTGLALASLLFTYENYPDDFQKICEWFPFARAVIWREKWYWDYHDPTDGKAAEKKIG